MANGTKIKCLARTKGFSIVNNVLLRDVRLTPKARHIGIFMLSQSDEWEYNINGLSKVIGSIGKTSLRAGIHELEQYGYLRRQSVRSNDGRFTGYDYVLVEEPENADGIQTLTDYYPSSEKRTTDNRTTDIQTLIIINPNNYQYYSINNNNNLVDVVGELQLNIHPKVVENLIAEYSLEGVTNGIEYGMMTMPCNPQNREGYIIDAIRKGYHLTSNEKNNLLKAAEAAKRENEVEKQKLAEGEAQKKVKNEENIATCDWWEMLSKSSKDYHWQCLRKNVNKLVSPFLEIEPPKNLNKLSSFVRFNVINHLTTQRKEETK